MRAQELLHRAGFEAIPGGIPIERGGEGRRPSSATIASASRLVAPRLGAVTTKKYGSATTAMVGPVPDPHVPSTVIHLSVKASPLHGTNPPKWSCVPRSVEVRPSRSPRTSHAAVGSERKRTSGPLRVAMSPYPHAVQDPASDVGSLIAEAFADAAPTPAERAAAASTPQASLLLTCVCRDDPTSTAIVATRVTTTAKANAHPATRTPARGEARSGSGSVGSGLAIRPSMRCIVRATLRHPSHAAM